MRSPHSMTRIKTNFISIDLYVFCINLDDGKFAAQLEPKLIGTDAQNLKFGNDPYGQRLLSTA